MSGKPFPVDHQLTAICMAFRNPRFIADEALPRYKVEKQSYRYTVYPLEQGFLLHDDAVGRRGQVREVALSGDEIQGETVDHALDDPVPVADHLDRPEGGKTFLGRKTEQLANLVALGREKRVADLIFDASKYPAGHKISLSGTASITDSASDPIGAIATALDKPVIRPNILTIGRAFFSVLARHPKIVKAVNGSDGGEGLVSREQLRALFDVEKLLIGEGFYIQGNRTADDSKIPVRLWGAKLAAYYLDAIGGPSENPSFGFTAQYGERISGSYFDPKIGMRGGDRLRVGESVDEQISAPRLGYLIEDEEIAA